MRKTGVWPPKHAILRDPFTVERIARRLQMGIREYLT